MKKRFLAVFLALVMCLGLVPTAFAGATEWLEYQDSRLSYGDILYLIEGEQIVIVGLDRNVSKLVIPSSLDGLPVTSISWDVFQDHTNLTSLTSVTIPDSVTNIGWDTFRDCTSLTNVTIGNSVTSIGQGVFKNCSSLTSVTIPDSVTEIGMSAFDGCTSLTSVTIPDSVTKIGMSAFDGCTSLTSVTIPNSVTSIEAGAFFECTSLTSVTIPDSVTSVRTQAFCGCTSLTNVTIPSSVTNIDDFAFQGCDSLTSVTISNSVTVIDWGAFGGCDSLTDVYYGGSEAQWSLMEIRVDNEPLEKATIHYNSAHAKFTDMKSNAFYLDAVEWALSKGITTGKTATTFAPDENCTHGQILTFLWRAAGSPASNAATPFTMKGNEYYYGAAKWAYEKGMIDKNFNPNANCTRAYAVLYIWQAFGKPAPSKASPFTDVPAHWSSAPAAAWTAEKGITTGTTATTFNPSGICNRGQIVTFLYRAYK